VEKILDKKVQGGKTHYKIKWQGYTDSESTWEPASNVVYVQEMIDDFEAKYAKSHQTEKKPPSPSKLQPASKKISKPTRPTRSSKNAKPKEEEEPKKNTTKTNNARSNNKKVEEVQLSLEQSGGFAHDIPVKITQHGLWEERGVTTGIDGKEGLERVMFQVEWKKRKDGTQPNPNYYRYSVLKKKCPTLLLDYIEGLVSFG